MKITLQLLTAAVAGLLALSALPASAQTGNLPTGTGTGALNSLTTGSYNTADGWYSLYSTQAGSYNTAEGYQSLYNNTGTFTAPSTYTGSYNTGLGYRALFTNATGNYNTAVGFSSLYANTGNGNTAVGYGSLPASTSDYNVAVGLNTLVNITSSTSGYDTAVGTSALQQTTGSYNIALGYCAGFYLMGGSNNIYIGNVGGAPGGGSATENGIVRIGTAGTHVATQLSGTVYCPALVCNGAVSCLTLSITSDRNAKERFMPVNAREVLDKVARLPISEWQYKAQSDTRHIGPMAQDFHAAFSVGSDEKHIATVDADGVALAAIQGLNEKLEAETHEKDARIKDLEKSVKELKNLVKELAGQRIGGAK